MVPFDRDGRNAKKKIWKSWTQWNHPPMQVWWKLSTGSSYSNSSIQSSIVHCSCACAWLGIAMRGFQRRPPLRMLNETGGNVEEESREDPISVDFNEIHRDNSRRSFVRWAPCDFTRELTCENFIARYSMCMNVFTFSLIFNRSNLVYSMFTKILPLINSNSD